MRTVATAVLVVGFLASGSAQGQGRDAARPPSDAEVKLLADISLQSGITRTWLPCMERCAANIGKPDAVYRTTLPSASAPVVTLVEVEARRYGTLLLAYELAGGGSAKSEPTWFGRDSAGTNAVALDRFFTAVAGMDLVVARQSAVPFLVSDLEVAARLARLEQVSGQAEAAKKTIAAIADKSVIPKGLADLLQRRLREDGDFSALNAIKFVSLHRELLGTLIK